ncbi:MAG: DoxX family membrane protein, partial [Flavisolibacter sp.]|nr:DoxX family membrane protein [Flavisolibacter sp.]
MKNIVTVIRFLVGALFIFSGLVKANDPMGLSFKMQEFFELWSTELASSYFFLKSFLISLFDVLHHYSLALSVIMITLEIIAGIALIIGWK